MTHTETSLPDAQKTREAPGRVLSRDTRVAVQEILSTVRRLGDVYAEETEALRRTDNNAFMALQDKKLEVARAYQNDMQQMVARKNELRALDPALRQRLKETQEEFSALARQNLEALERMQRCTRRLGDTVRNAAIRAVQKDSGYVYGEDGALSNAARRKSVSSGVSETV